MPSAKTKPAKKPKTAAKPRNAGKNGILASKRQRMMTVTLASVGNPDLDQDPTRKLYSAEANRTAFVSSFEEASKVCRKFIQDNDLGGGNWAGGTIKDKDGNYIGRVSYNGRVWEQKFGVADNDQKEIKFEDGGKTDNTIWLSIDGDKPITFEEFHSTNNAPDVQPLPKKTWNDIKKLKPGYSIVIDMGAGGRTEIERVESGELPKEPNMPTFIPYNGVEILHSAGIPDKSIPEEYYVNDRKFETLEAAKKHIDKGAGAKMEDGCGVQIEIGDFIRKRDNKLGKGIASVTQGYVYEKNGDLVKLKDEYGNKSDRWHALTGFKKSKTNYDGVKMENGGSTKLYSSYKDPILYIESMGAVLHGGINLTDKNKIAYYLATKGNKAIVVAFGLDATENNWMIDKEDAREMSAKAKELGSDAIELYTNYGVELHSKHEKPTDIGFDKIYKVSEEFEDGGGIPNNYKGKTAEQVWNGWIGHQRRHFLYDHLSTKLNGIAIDKIIPSSYEKISTNSLIGNGIVHGVNYKMVLNEINNHITQGQYQNGGDVNSDIANPTSEILVKPLAIEFAKEINAYLTPDQVAEVNRLNATPEYSNGACATHNYIDANEAMADAWQKVMDREFNFVSEDVMLSGSRSTQPPDIMEDVELWNNAWELAKQNGFDVAKIENKQTNNTMANGGRVSNQNKTWIVNIAMPSADNNNPKLRKEEIVLGRLSDEFDVKQAIIRKGLDWIGNGKVLSIVEKKANGGKLGYDNDTVEAIKSWEMYDYSYINPSDVLALSEQHEVFAHDLRDNSEFLLDDSRTNEQVQRLIDSGDFAFFSEYPIKGYDHPIIFDDSDQTDDDQMEYGGKVSDTYVAVAEKDGYWTIISTPTTKEKAQFYADHARPIQGETQKVVPLSEALAYPKVIGTEYLAAKDSTAVNVHKSQKQLVADILYTDGANYKKRFVLALPKGKKPEIYDEVPSTYFGIDEQEWYDSYLFDYDPEIDHNTLEITDIRERKEDDVVSNESSNQMAKGGKITNDPLPEPIAGKYIYADVKNDFVDNDVRHIDAWLTDDENESGRTVAKLYPTGEYELIDPNCVKDPLCNELIREGIELAKKGEFKNGGTMNPQSEMLDKFHSLTKNKYKDGGPMKAKSISDIVHPELLNKQSSKILKNEILKSPALAALPPDDPDLLALLAAIADAAPQALAGYVPPPPPEPEPIVEPVVEEVPEITDKQRLQIEVETITDLLTSGVIEDPESVKRLRQEIADINEIMSLID